MQSEDPRVFGEVESEVAAFNINNQRTVYEGGVRGQRHSSHTWRNITTLAVMGRGYPSALRSFLLLGLWLLRTISSDRETTLICVEKKFSFFYLWKKVGKTAKTITVASANVTVLVLSWRYLDIPINLMFSFSISRVVGGCVSTTELIWVYVVRGLLQLST